MVSEKI